MRQHFTADWAFGIRGAIENIVRRNFPQDLRNWPLLQTFDFEAYKIGKDYMVILLKDKLSGIPSGPGEPKEFPFSDHPSIPPKAEEIELWQFYLRNKFNLREEDAPFLIPIRDSGKNDASQDYNLFTPEEQYFWNRQLSYVVSRYKTYIQSTAQMEPSQPTYITYNVSGTNTRVNINSTDSSVNIISTESVKIFNNLRKLLQYIENKEERAKIAQSIDAMEQCVGRDSFLTRYQEFMGIIANHMTVFGPLIPVLTSLLS